jgi:hypothetical protein
VFVRDGFHFWAFVLGPVWMLRHRLWLVLLIYIVLTTALQIGLHALGVSAEVRFMVGFLIALLVGFEAATLRRWTYGRRRWTNLGIVVGRNREEAERRFFDRWSGTLEPVAPSPPPIPSTDLRMPQAPTQVIGLFPEPQSRP